MAEPDPDSETRPKGVKGEEEEQVAEKDGTSAAATAAPGCSPLSEDGKGKKKKKFERVHLDSITFFRYAGSVFILAYHCFRNESPLWRPLWQWANVWLCFFFVLSGFVLAFTSITSTSLPPTGRPSLLKYLLHRLSGIYPLYLLVLVICLPSFQQGANSFGGWTVGCGWNDPLSTQIAQSYWRNGMNPVQVGPLVLECQAARLSFHVALLQGFVPHFVYGSDPPDVLNALQQAKKKRKEGDGGKKVKDTKRKDGDKGGKVVGTKKREGDAAQKVEETQQKEERGNSENRVEREGRKRQKKSRTHHHRHHHHHHRSKAAQGQRTDANSVSAHTLLAENSKEDRKSKGVSLLSFSIHEEESGEGTQESNTTASAHSSSSGRMGILMDWGQSEGEVEEEDGDVVVPQPPLTPFGRVTNIPGVTLPPAGGGGGHVKTNSHKAWYVRFGSGVLKMIRNFVHGLWALGCTRPVPLWFVSALFIYWILFWVLLPVVRSDKLLPLSVCVVGMFLCGVGVTVGITYFSVWWFQTFKSFDGTCHHGLSVSVIGHIHEFLFGIFVGRFFILTAFDEEGRFLFGEGRVERGGEPVASTEQGGGAKTRFGFGVSSLADLVKWRRRDRRKEEKETGEKGEGGETESEKDDAKSASRDDSPSSSQKSFVTRGGCSGEVTRTVTEVDSTPSLPQTATATSVEAAEGSEGVVAEAKKGQEERESRKKGASLLWVLPLYHWGVFLSLSAFVFLVVCFPEPKGVVQHTLASNGGAILPVTLLILGLSCGQDAISKFAKRPECLFLGSLALGQYLLHPLALHAVCLLSGTARLPDAFHLLNPTVSEPILLGVSGALAWAANRVVVDPCTAAIQRRVRQMK
uniref:Uncharacterized protein n=1 Tax=Chromera velia CCMP2878 TaxID=1169474 RepID=A0A0G4F9Y6_9ALVE|eukprot:Cvel_15790.t1-p1 / transcript=Cvel_15790.t1 / gene=Cvel_15790 / organism=Chromera_velia_CCMP2878 / gene_product=hypothetical protein / transcript_product=hypothetical protein / location=Cvel_scaffold1185:20244-23053(+) / protein_length=859 / sequence_SO=supercontig / SO=protein_coding / is_pseudo=false